VARLVHLTISLVTAVTLGWTLFLASMSVFGPSGAFCLDPDGSRPPSTGCVHVSIDPVTGRGVSNHETARVDASGVTTWYHVGTAVTGPVALPMFLTVPSLTAAIYLVIAALERRDRDRADGRAAHGTRPEPGRP
ncbi:MAG TPA: hypothetical protein VEY67_03940, partial [Candidatus Dormibacteraeota bacterium]|nr:hypothetical protein [Candidatus Dormibacteraeota bacterium]